MVTINTPQDTQEIDVINKYHPIVYFLVILLKYDNTKSSKCYLLIKKYLEIYNVKIQEEINDNEHSTKENEMKTIEINNISNQLNRIKIEENNNFENNKFKIDIIDIIYSCIDE